VAHRVSLALGAPSTRKAARRSDYESFVTDLDLGVRAPLGAAPEQLSCIRELALRLSDGLADSLFLVGTAEPRAFDPLVALGGLVADSGVLVLGELPSPLHRRAPALLAKVISTFDVISGGRAVVVLGRDRATSVMRNLEVEMEALRATLRLADVSFEAPAIALVRARNVPLAATRPVPIGLYLDAAAWSTPGDGEATVSLDLLALAARCCELLFVEVADELDVGAIGEAIPDAVARAGRLRGDLLVRAVLPSRETTPDRVREIVTGLGADGVVLDVSGPCDSAQLEATYALLGELRRAPSA